MAMVHGGNKAQSTAEIKLRGVIHIHSRISYDGQETIARLAEFFRSRGYDFMCITEHSDGLKQEDMQRIIEECAQATREDFIAVPGVEFSCRRRLHLLGIGVTEPVDSHDPVPVTQHIRSQGGVAILAHPCAYGAETPDELAGLLHGIEIWNQPKDGKLGPGAEPLRLWKRWRALNPALRAVGAIDFHRLDSPSSLGMEISVSERTPKAVIQALKNGPVRLKGPWVALSGETPPEGWPETKYFVLSRIYLSLRATRNFLTGRKR